MIQILESALRDLDDGYDFYESQEMGLGDYFVAAVRADIESLRISAGIHARAYRDYHRLLCRVFPFAVFYLFENREVIVYAIIDCRRNPSWIDQHLSDHDRPGDPGGPARETG